MLVNHKVDDLLGLLVALRRADFKVRNVGSDSRGTYVYLEPEEEKDPAPIVEAWVWKPAPKPSATLKEIRLKVKEEKSVREQEKIENERKREEAMVKAGDRVDILVANQNTLPWLKLLYSQYHKFKPSIQSQFFVCDNGSTDGSREWLASSGIQHYQNPDRQCHADGLIHAIKRTTAPYIAYVDVDAFPIHPHWLDEAIHTISNERVGATGLSRKFIFGDGRREFVHPSFCVFSRELYDRLSLDPAIVHMKDFSYDVGESMCRKLEDNGYSLSFTGPAFLEQNAQTNGQKVLHVGGSCWILSAPSLPEDFITSNVKVHRSWLLRLGLWEDFIRYLKESVSYNPLCARYF